MPNSPSRLPTLAPSSAPTAVANAAALDEAPQARRITLPRLATIVGVAAVLHLGQEVFLPLAIAMLLTFALSPAVSAFRKRGAPLTASVLVVAFLAFSAIAAFSLVVAGQLSGLARDLPSFQQNILTKLEGLKAQGGENGLVARLTDMAGAINDEITTALPAEGEGAAATPAAPDGPMQVEVVERQSPLDMLVNLVGPCSHKKYICQPPSKRVICTALQAVGFYIYRNKCLLGMARRKLHTKKRCARTDFDDVNGAFLPLVKFKTVFGIVKLCKLVFFAFARDDEVFWVEQLRHYTYYTAQRVSAKHSRFHRRQSPRISV